MITRYFRQVGSAPWTRATREEYLSAAQSTGLGKVRARAGAFTILDTAWRIEMDLSEPLEIEELAADLLPGETVEYRGEIRHVECETK